MSSELDTYQGLDITFSCLITPKSLPEYLRRAMAALISIGMTLAKDCARLMGGNPKPPSERGSVG